MWDINTFLRSCVANVHSSHDQPGLDSGNILNVGGFSGVVVSVVVAFLADDNGRFLARVEKVY